MKQKKPSTVRAPNLKIVYWFGICIFLLVGLSLFFKVLTVALRSHFDGKHRFSIDIQSNSGRMIVSLEPLTSSESILKIPKDVHGTRIGKLLKIPIDGKIQLSNDYAEKLLEKKDITDSDITNFFTQTLFHYQSLDTDLTFIDLLRLFVSASTLSRPKVKVSSLVAPLNDYETDKVISALFNDSSVSQENVSIQIVNATSVSGLGNRLARLITNSGGTVVSVATSEVPVTKSRITYIGEKTYTVNRLAQILHFALVPFDASISPTPFQIDSLDTISRQPFQPHQESISDIIILIGTDDSTSVPF